MGSLLPVIAVFKAWFALCVASQPPVLVQSLTPTTSRMLVVFDNFLEFNRRSSDSRGNSAQFGEGCGRNPENPSYSGFCNNFLRNDWGSAKSTFKKVSTPFSSYAFGRPNARRVSNIVCRSTGKKPNRRGISEFTTFFGQFLDHTVTETENTRTRMPIPIPNDDPVFKYGGMIPFFRTVKSGFGTLKSPINILSSYIDAASVYGADDKKANSLRLRRNGLLKMSAGNLLPLNNGGFFLAGDARVNGSFYHIVYPY